MMNRTKSTLFVVLCAIAPVCWAESEPVLAEQFKSAASFGGKMLYDNGKNTIPVFLIDKVEREAQLKELREMNWKEAVTPVATGAVAGVLYGMVLQNLLKETCSGMSQKELVAVITTGATFIGFPIFKKILFGYLHPNETKRAMVDTIDTMATTIAMGATLSR